MRIHYTLLRQFLFGELVKLTEKYWSPNGFYYSDLYHDALWLEEYVEPNLKTPRTFVYGVRPEGTYIGNDEQLSVRNFPHTYRVTITTHPRHQDYLEIVLLKLG